jgi:hypothetical protein
MARKPLILHVATIGAVTHGIKQPDDYAAINAIVGIKKATSSDKVDDSTEVNSLRRSGKLVKLSCRLANKKVNTIQCTTEKVSGAVAGLLGKALDGSTITSVSIPRKRNRR